VSDFNERIIAEFRANNGVVGQPFEGRPMVLLHTVGARSGEARINPLATFPEDGSWLVVASAGGQPSNPAWYHNLLAQPDVSIEFGAQTIPVHASELEGADRDAAWQRITDELPGFLSYEQRTSRTIPVLRLTRR
jgi:deazaflavin-dependent oxidoreductase (nitroreductase family)